VLHGLLSTSQFIAIILVILGVALFVRARRRVAA